MKHLIILMLTISVAVAIQSPKTDNKLQTSEQGKPKREAALENARSMFYPSAKYFAQVQPRATFRKTPAGNYHHREYLSDFNGFRASASDIAMPKLETYIIKTETGSDGNPSVIYKVFAMSPNIVASTFANDDKIHEALNYHGSQTTKDGSFEDIDTEANSYSHYMPKANTASTTFSSPGHIQTVIIPYQHTSAGQKMLYRHGNRNSALGPMTPNHYTNHIEYQQAQLQADEPSHGNCKHAHIAYQEGYSQGSKHNYNHANSFNKNQSMANNEDNVAKHQEQTSEQHFMHNKNNNHQMHNHNEGATLTLVSQSTKSQYGYDDENGDLSSSLDALANSFGKSGLHTYPNYNYDIPSVTVGHVSESATSTPMLQHDGQTPAYAHGHQGLSHFGAQKPQDLHTDIVNSDKYDAMKSHTFKPSHFLGTINEPTQHTDNHGSHASQYYQPPPPTSGNYDYPDPTMLMKQKSQYAAPVYESESMYSMPQASNHQYTTTSTPTTTTQTSRPSNFHQKN